MANTKAAKKALRSSIKKNEVNSARKSRIRTFIKKVDDAIKSSDQAKARRALASTHPHQTTRLLVN